MEFKNKRHSKRRGNFIIIRTLLFKINRKVMFFFHININTYIGMINTLVIVVKVISQEVYSDSFS